MVTGGTLEYVTQNPRVLITGGYGFIGGRLVHYLVEMGYQVVIGSRTKRAPPQWCPRAKVVQLQWSDESLIHACEGIDVVIHTAGMNADDCVADPVGALEFNAVATARLVQASISAGVSRIIYLSTAHVYGSPLIGIIDEQTCPRNLHPYATSHLAGESALLSAIQNSREITGVVLRLSNVVGSPMTKDVNCWMLLVNDLCRQAIVKGTLTLESPGNNQRDFVPMANVVSILGHLISNEVSGVTLNVGSGSIMTLLEMAEKIQSRCKKVLGFFPVIRSTSDECVLDKQIDLKYRISRLEELDLLLPACLDDEIDKLLFFCKKHFS